MNTNFTPLGGQDTRHAYGLAGDLLSPEGLQTRLEDALRPVLTTVQRKLAQMARAQIDAALEPMHDAIRRQVDLTIAPIQATLMAEVDRALDSVREDWRRQVERALEPVQQMLDAQIDRALQPLFTGAEKGEAGHNAERRASSAATTASMDVRLAEDTHEEYPQAKHTQDENAQVASLPPVEVSDTKPKRRAAPRKTAEAPKRPSVDQAPKPPSSARSAVGQSSVRPATSTPGARSSAGQSTVRSSVGKTTVRSSVPRAVPRSSTVKPSRKKSTSGANSDA